MEQYLDPARPQRIVAERSRAVQLQATTLSPAVYTDNNSTATHTRAVQGAGNGTVQLVHMVQQRLHLAIKTRHCSYSKAATLCLNYA
jgi:hypothetical protein